jgi:serine/threonine protein kinase
VGKAPFYHIRREETKKRIINAEKTVISYPSHLSEHAVSFIDNLIKKDPNDRLNAEILLEHPFLKNVETNC